MSSTMRHRPARSAWVLLFWALVLAVSWLMLVPRPPAAIDTGWDKLNHGLAFAAVAFAGVGALRHQGAAARWRLALALLAWGALLEFAQTLQPARSAEWADALANAVGIAVGQALAARWWPPASLSVR